MTSSPGTALSPTAGGTRQSSRRQWNAISAPQRPAPSTTPDLALPQAPLPDARQPLANDVSSRFGRRLRELRLSRDLTQADMARKFGIDRSFISEIECGRKAVSLPMIEVIALGLQMSLSDLFEGL